MDVRFNKEINFINSEIKDIQEAIKRGCDPTEIMIRINVISTHLFNISRREMQERTMRDTDDGLENMKKTKDTHNNRKSVALKSVCAITVIVFSILGGHAALNGAKALGKVAQLGQTAAQTLSQTTSILDETQAKERVGLNHYGEQTRTSQNQHYQSLQGDRAAAEKALNAMKADAEARQRIVSELTRGA